MRGVLAAGTVVLSDDGMEIVDVPEPAAMSGYRVKRSWKEIDGKIWRVHSFVPIEGTAEEAALRLSKLQFMSLPDDAAWELRALADDFVVGKTYYGPDDPSGFPQSRVRYLGDLYKVLQTHVSQADWTPDAAPSLYALILPGQEGGVGEWVQPDSTNGYALGDRVRHLGRTWESVFDGQNVWEPGAVGVGEDIWKDVTGEM